MAHKYGLDEGKVYAMEATSYDYSFVSDGEKATTGKFLLAGKELARYTLTAKTLTLKVEDTETKYTAYDETVITGFESKIKEIDVDDIIQTEVVTLEKHWISDRLKNIIYEFRKDEIIMALRQDNGKYVRQTRPVKYNDDMFTVLTDNYEYTFPLPPVASTSNAISGGVTERLRNLAICHPAVGRRLPAFCHPSLSSSAF